MKYKAQYMHKPRNRNKPHICHWTMPDPDASKGYAERTKGYATAAEAYRAVADKQAEIESGSLFSLDGNETFGQFSARWLDQARGIKSPRTITNHEYMLRCHILPRIGDIPLSAITPAICRGLVLESGMTKAVRHRVWATFYAIMRRAYRDKLIPSNPVRDAEIDTGYTTERAELVPVTWEQLEIIAASNKPHWQLATWLQFGCGLRLGESLAVKIDNVLEDGTVLRTEEKVVINRSKGSDDPVIEAHKARKRITKRDIPLSPWLLAKIREHCADFGIESGYLFPDIASGAVQATNWRTGFNSGRIKAGVKPLVLYNGKRQNLTPHNLRHRFASMLLERGVPISNVAKWMGHRNVQTTFETYSHFMPSAVGSARNVLESAITEFKEDK